METLGGLSKTSKSVANWLSPLHPCLVTALGLVVEQMGVREGFVEEGTFAPTWTVQKKPEAERRKIWDGSGEA